MLEQKVETFLRRKQFPIENKSIVIGVSGGPDSLALLHFLWSREEKWHIKVVAAHVDHMLRGSESEEEALFVKEFCRQRGIPFEWKQINVPLYMEKSGVSVEIAARNCRYAFFKEVLEKYSCPLLALGHHGDDQVETILMRLTRGSTGKARAGIPFSRPFAHATLFRPFLCVSRDEIEEYCKKYNLDPRRDSSNEELIYTRNRFRKRILPFLKKENPQVHEHFQRFSEDLQEDEAFLHELAKEKLNTVVKAKNHENWLVDVQKLNDLPYPLQRRGIQLILNCLYKEKPSSLSAVHIDQILQLVRSSHPSGMLDLPNGLKVIRSYGECTFGFEQEGKENPYKIEITKSGEYFLPNGDKLEVNFGEHICCTSDKNTMIVHIDEKDLPLFVRTREKGDRMTIKGMKGSKKIKDIFIDEKIPLHKRNSWPIVTNRSNEIIWLCGLKKGNLYQRKDSSQRRTIFMKYIRVNI